MWLESKKLPTGEIKTYKKKSWSGTVCSSAGNLAIHLDLLILLANFDHNCFHFPQGSHWVEDRTLSLYTPAPNKGKSDLGALQTWKDSMQWLIDDLKWLLSLEYHR